MLSGLRFGSRSALAALAAASLVLFGSVLKTDAQSSASTRLHTVDQLSRSVLAGTQSPDALSQAVITGAYDADLATATSLVPEFSSAQAVFVAGSRTKSLTDLDVTSAFDAWRKLIGDPNELPTSPLAIHWLRASLSTVTPYLISKDANGLPAKNVSPLEALYLLDFLVAHGAVPQLSKQMPLPDVGSYSNALTAYNASTVADQRVADITGVASKYLLP